jgi:hypothetical protein
MTMPTSQAVDSRQQLSVAPTEIKSGDWLHDLGTLRQVDYVDSMSTSVGTGTIHIVHFHPQPGVANKALGMTGRTPSLTIWRKSAT